MVVDDHPIVRRGLAELISQESRLQVCAEASSAPEALDMIRTAAPDLVIVDLSLKNGSGLELIKKIKAIAGGRIKVLVCSMHEERRYADRALSAGAMGYISKEEATGKLCEAIQQVLDGKIYLSPQMTEWLLHRAVGGRGPDIPRGAPMDELTDRELEVFELIGQGLTSRQIANRLSLSQKTIEAHRENIKNKLNLRNSVEVTRRAVEWLLEKT